MARTSNRLKALSVERVKDASMYADGDGLYLHVSDTGAKSWILRYRLNGKRRDMGLGRYPLFSLADARERANAPRRLIADKIDPLAARDAERKAAAVQAEKGRGVAFEIVAKECIERKRSAWRGSDQEHQWDQSMRDHVYPYIGKRTVAEIGVADVRGVLERIWLKTPATARKLRGRIEAVLDYAVAKEIENPGTGYRPAGDNPARLDGPLAVLLPDQAGTNGQHGALPYVEINKFMTELATVSPPVAAKALAFTILTAARTGETLGATWSEVDLAARVWTIPAGRMKAGAEHKVPLSASALALLDALPRDGDRIFKIGERTMYHVAKRLRPGATTHGFRATFRTWAQEATEFSSEVAEHCLAHIEGSASELAYKRGDAIDKRRAVMDAWASYCGCGAVADRSFLRC